ncbi:hypothetical protein R69658_02538 [Paraburkholderia aspalathi]|uniref:Uncharacterized protein n=1 Tax=Paraburkholderia aspalathi TaxID=1324617 RepID=A0ABM8RDH3_9BURK|nr:hypothetical protein [Paraburkholderia aspalathi]MBK3817802.1 hypothetical protein [Paraburkholderia aspalathi]MBK3829582.1 hypothetical protein [Paraburkholderia aspalathi]MBK3859402.1 hypothetical protein [Paraburkholderia aspalathi]CAE6747090.1 hypothetical protein R69658_02538 [Paraburkholderia aspalathi]
MKKILASVAMSLCTLACSAATLNPIQLLNPTGSVSGQAIISTGASTAPAWGNVTAAALAAQAANTVVANVTASSHTPTAVAMPSCSAAGSALNYTSGTGWGCATGIALTGVSLAQFAATTSAQLLGVVSDETGTGSLVFGTSPTIGTPTINTPTISGGTISNTPISGSTGSFTTLTASGLVTPAYPAGIKGNVTGSAVTAGSIGEYPSNSASAVSQTSATVANITSLPLTAGDWDVGCSYSTNPAGTTTTSAVNFGLTTTSGAQAPANQRIIFNLAVPAGVGLEMACPTVRILLSSSSTVYLTAAPTFATSTLTANGFIWARRR